MPSLLYCAWPKQTITIKLLGDIIAGCGRLPFRGGSLFYTCLWSNSFYLAVYRLSSDAVTQGMISRADGQNMLQLILLHFWFQFA